MILLLPYILLCPSLSSALGTSPPLRIGKEEMTLTRDQRVQLDALKKDLDPKIKAHTPLGNDVVLAQFLAYQYWDVQKAKEALAAALKWDNEKRLIGPNAVSDDAYPGLKKRIGGELDGVDKEGRTVVFLKWNKWEWSDAFATNEMDKWKNTCYKMMDEAQNRTLYNYDSGTVKHVRFYIILDFVWWDSQKGITPKYMAEFADMAKSLDLRWPRTMSDIVVINTPPAFSFILALPKPIFSKNTFDALKPYGQDKKQWFHVLQKDISDKELQKFPLDDTEGNNPNVANSAKTAGVTRR